MDFILLNLSFVVAMILSHSSNLILENSIMYLLLLILNFTWFFYTSSTGFYQEFLTRPFPIQFLNILKLSLLVTIVSVLFFFVIKQPIYTRILILLNGFFLLFTITVRTIISKWALRMLRNKGKSVRNLLIIGADEIGEKFKAVIINNPEFGHRFIGFVNQFPAKNVIGIFSDLDYIIKNNDVEDVVITLHDYTSENLDDIVNICNKNAVKIHVIPDYFRFLSGRFQISTVSNLPVITIRDEPLNEAIMRLIKRVFDIFFSLIIILFILSWLIPVLGLLIKLDSPGTVFFIQERFGARKRKFNCYKFRTLAYEKRDPEKFEPIIQKDPRVTRVGKILRKTNIDEILQFINVLKGDMSVVGPRPLPLGVEMVYEKVFEEIKMRYNVRPGITGWAQINGLRGEVVDEEENKRRIREKMKYDLWYIENWSMKLDFQIILLTIWHMIRGDTKGF
ncbi:MAG: exopolysaccharide biosynthesis polyprenyl glycosylphosphotransferase [Ignavibacteriaceae bacterium]